MGKFRKGITLLYILAKDVHDITHMVSSNRLAQKDITVPAVSCVPPLPNTLWHFYLFETDYLYRNTLKKWNIKDGEFPYPYVVHEHTVKAMQEGAELLQGGE